MQLLTAIEIAWRALGVNRVRSVLTLLGVIIGVGLIVMVATVGASAKHMAGQEIEKLGTNLIQIVPGAAQFSGRRTALGERPTLTLEDADALKAEIPYVDDALGLVFGDVQIGR
ncbi:MAG TPA: ABC transporter permease, partial [Sphingomonadales bacterium]|nr:ABC transporter permease [Sphingomonadales bacterium]